MRDGTSVFRRARGELSKLAIQSTISVPVELF